MCIVILTVRQHEVWWNNQCNSLNPTSSHICLPFSHHQPFSHITMFLYIVLNVIRVARFLYVLFIVIHLILLLATIITFFDVFSPLLIYSMCRQSVEYFLRNVYNFLQYGKQNVETWTISQHIFKIFQQIFIYFLRNSFFFFSVLFGCRFQIKLL